MQKIKDMISEGKSIFAFDKTVYNIYIIEYRWYQQAK